MISGSVLNSTLNASLPEACTDKDVMPHTGDILQLAQRIAKLGSWKFHLAQNFLELSDEVYHLYGVTPGEFTPTVAAIKALMHPEDVPAIWAAGRQAMARGGEMNLEHRVIRPSGEVRYVHSRGKVLMGHDRQPFFFGTVQDITERRLGEMRLRESETLVRLAGQIARMGGWEVNVAGDQVRWSDQVCDIFDVPCGSTLTIEQASRFYVGPYQQKMTDAFNACVMQGVAFDEELGIVTASGRNGWVRIIGQPVQDHGDVVTRVCGAVQDITEKKLAEAKVVQLAARLASTLENITDAFITLDRDWAFTYLNREAGVLLRRDRDQLLGKRIWDALPGGVGGQFYPQFHRALSENCTVEFEAHDASLGEWLQVLAYPSEEGLAIYLRDISERKRLQAAMLESEERFRIVAKVTSDTIWDWDLIKDTIWWNEGVASLSGYAQHEIEPSSLSWTNRIHPEDKPEILASIYAAIEGSDEKWSGEYRFLRRDGDYAFVLDRGFIIRDEQGKAIRMVGSVIDLTAVKQAEKERRAADARIREQASLLDKAKDAIIVRGMDNRIHFWNKGAERLYGWSAEEAVGRLVEDLLVEDFDAFRKANKALLKNGEWDGESIKRRKDGRIVTIEVNWTLVYGDDGTPQSIFAIETDITQRKITENEVQQLAFFDPLTRLPNRMLLLNRLQKALLASARHRKLGAFLFIDLDNFKSLNDSLGHDQGDLLLREVAARLIGCVRISDTVARLGGDEFVVMLEELSEQVVDAAAQARAIGEKILAAFTMPFQLSGYEYFNTPSIGVALFDGESNTVDDVMKRADVAMYQAKSAGRNTMRFFDPQMQAVVNERVALEKDLRQALIADEFILHYQPQLNAARQVTGVEALLRWHQPQRGMVSPAAFIPLAEDTGLIVQIGHVVLRKACVQLAAWAGMPDMRHLSIAVNVSARQFRHPDFVAQVVSSLTDSGADPFKLKLELTESLLVEDVEATIEKMDALKAIGVGFSLDDFGTGYSSLSYLKRLPLDQLKIDQSFVNDMLTDPNGAAIVRTIIALGSALGLGVIAEGVETAEQCDFLTREGCSAFQGYHFSQPLPADKIPDFLRCYEGVPAAHNAPP